MVRKIISGGQTGADQAALDVAMDFGISYGGWVPKGRKTEKGPLSPRYAQMQESDSGRYADRTLRNVTEADGTLILSHGKLSGGSRLTAVFARQHGRPCLHVDLLETFRFKAAETIRSWISTQRIQVLNVAGPRASADPKIYQASYDILQTALFMDMAFSSPTAHRLDTHPSIAAAGPATISDAASALMAVMTLREKTWIARQGENDLGAVVVAMAPLMKEQRAWPEDNPELMAACLMTEAPGPVTLEQAPLILIRSVWHQLRRTHALRRIK